MKEWTNIYDFFQVINTTKYVVLRNFENLTSEIRTELHPDIDILCADRDRMICLSGSDSRTKNPRDEIHRKVKIGNSVVDLDIRCVGDGYYDSKWEKRIINNRKFWNNLCFIPSQEDYYFSLLYHALIQKNTLSTDYERRLTEMGNRMGIPSPVSINTLEDYMRNNNYFYTYPESSGTVLNISASDKKLVELNLKRKSERVYKQFKKMIQNRIMGRNY